MIYHHWRRIWTLVKKKNWCSWTRSDLILTEITVRKGILLYNGRYSYSIQYFEPFGSDQEKVAACCLRSSVHKSCAIAKKNKKEIRKITLDPFSSFWSRGNILMASQWSWHELMVWRSQYYRYKNMFMLLSDWFDFLKRKYELVKYRSEVHTSVYWFGLYVISGLPRI